MNRSGTANGAVAWMEKPKEPTRFLMERETLYDCRAGIRRCEGFVFDNKFLELISRKIHIWKINPQQALLILMLK